jgi:general secretion pathway protein C
LWLLAAGSAVFWGLRLGRAPSTPAPPAAATQGPVNIDVAAITRLLGGAPQAPGMAAAPVASLASRFSLVGVVAEARSGIGAAVISIDGKPARPYRVGSALDEGLVLQSVQGRRAAIGPRAGPPAVTLELPPLQK